MLKFTERPKTQGITSKKTWLSLKRISCLQVIFVLICMKGMLICFNLQRDKTGNGLPNNDIVQQKVCSCKCQFYTKICAWSRLVSQFHVIAGKKYLMCPMTIKMLMQHVIANSNLHNLKIYSLKGWIKTSQSLNMNYIYVA